MSSLSIEEQVVQTYQDNIDYFKSYQPALLEKIIAFESALENGYYKSKYELEYKEDSYFDVKELSSGNYLYGSDSDKYAQDIAKSVDYRKKDNIFIVSPRFTFSKESLEYIENTNINSNNTYGVARLLDYINQNLTDDMTMKKIDKFVFFGVGLGKHIQSVHEKIDADYYLLVEDDLELFRLSMFVTNYKKLSFSCELTFCVFEDNIEAKYIMNEFLENAFMHNHYLKFIHTRNHSEEKMKILHEVISSQSHIAFPYHAYFNKYLRPLEYIKEKYSFLNLNAKEKILSKRPVLLLAAGPSLQKNLSWVKQNQDRFTIIALTSTLNTLEKEGIKPDIITHLDPFAKGSLPHVEKLTTREYFEESICLFSSQSPHEVTQMFKKENVFIYENGTFYKKGYGSLGSACVGSMSYVLSLVLGVNDLYLLGLDLAIDEETGSTHSSSHEHSQILDTSSVDQMQEVFSFKDSVIKVKGNFKDEVLTTANFYISIESIKTNTKLNKKPNQTVYNLSNGAYLEDSIPLRLDELEIENFSITSSKEKFNELLPLFLHNSTSSLSKEELSSIEKMLKHAKKVKKILKKHKSIDHKTADSYKYALLGLSLDITADKSKEAEQLNLVNLYYMQYIYPYIFDFLNTKEVKSIPVHIKKIDSLLIPKMVEIAEEFEKRLEQFVQEEELV